MADEMTREEASHLVIQAIVQRGYYRCIKLKTADAEEILMVVLSHTFSPVSTHEKSVRIQQQLESRTDRHGELLPTYLYTHLMEHEALYRFVLGMLRKINRLLGSE